MADRDLAAHALRGCDAGFLYVESDSQPVTIPCLMALGPRDGTTPRPLTFAEFRAHFAARVPYLPPLRWRLVRAPLGLYRPFFVEDPAFDLDFHLRHVTLPAPGGDVELNRLVADGAERRLDRRHPLWQITLVDGLADGSQAIMLRVSHGLADGGAMSTIMRTLFSDEEPSAELVANSKLERPPTVPRRDLLRDAVTGQLKGLARLPGFAKDTKDKIDLLKAREQESKVPVPALVEDTPVCSINDAFSGRRVYARVLLPLDDVRAVRRAADVTVDAVMLAVTGGALRSYLAEVGDLPDRPLTANVPMASEVGGANDRPWGNYFANYLATLATDEPDPWARLLRIGEIATESRQRLEILGLDTIVRWLDYVPSAIGEPGGVKMGEYRRSHPEKIDFSVLMSNFPGPRERLGFSHVQLDHMYVSGPTTDGEGLNITAWSYCDEVALVVLAHAEALAEPQRFVDGFRTALAELVDAARQHGGGA